MTNTKKQVKQVTIIPARIEKGSELVGKRTNRRVAAYARVSTNRECQQTSYEAQIQYYTRYIEKKPDWIFAGIYADEWAAQQHSNCNEMYYKSEINKRKVLKEYEKHKGI